MHRVFVLLLVALLPPTSALAAQPNVLLVMCDDLGYGDPQAFHPASPILTPHIDAMAKAGLTFTRFYSAAPVCSPTRGSCLTGRHPYRYGIYTANSGHIKEQEITLPELLKEQGYTTGHFGKWHLGTLTTTVTDANRGGPRGKQHFAPPREHGYDVSFVTESKVPTYDPMIMPRGAKSGGNWDALTDKTNAVPYGTRYWDHDGNEVTENLDGDDSRVIMDRAIPFIERAAANDQPFFAAIWFHAPHLPCVASPDHVRHYQDHDVAHRNYYGCITALDEQLGRLRDRLQQLELADNTMLWFCSDNGPEGKNETSPGSAGSFRGRKRSLYEGGVRVPGILVWPGHTSPGTSTDFPAVTSDYLPTVLDALQLSYPDDRPVDGISLIDAIDDRNAKRTEGIGFQSHHQIAWHHGNYKVISTDQGKTWELYDLANDPGEQIDLADSDPQRLATMTADVIAWQQSCQASDSEQDYSTNLNETDPVVDPQQKAWHAKYKDQANIPLPHEMLLNSDPEPALTQGFTPMFNGQDLTGWTPKGGTCTFQMIDGHLQGQVVPGSNSTYLCTDKSDYKDFIFTCDMKWLADGNSGIMFRAQEKPASRGRVTVFGPQAEMEGISGDRQWSGGIYGQSCGGYFYPLWLKQHQTVRAALNKTDWNRITIQARGDTVKTWLNGVPAAHWHDDGTYAQGFFGLQIHKGQSGTVLWRNVRIKELTGIDARRRKPNPAFAPVVDDPALPRVLLIGDSISIGYTVPVREMLAGKANVHRIPTNGGPTTRGLENLDRWLGDGHWDVIHFNWGLHDLKYVNAKGGLVDVSQGRQQVPIDQYETNLRKLVGRLSQTGAKLIWRSTTPVPAGAKGRVVGDAAKYNRVAEAIMREHDIAIDDQYTLVLPRLGELQLPANVHFTAEGSRQLATEVVGAIHQQIEP